MKLEAVPITFENSDSVTRTANKINDAFAEGDIYLGHVAVEGPQPESRSGTRGPAPTEGIVLLIDRYIS